MRKFLNFCSRNLFWTVSIGLALAAFIAIGISLAVVPGLVPTIAAFAIGGVKLFGFLSTLPVIAGAVPAAAAATFGAICFAGSLVLSSLTRLAYKICLGVDESAQKDSVQRNLDFMTKDPEQLVDLDGNDIDNDTPTAVVRLMAEGMTMEEANEQMAITQFKGGLSDLQKTAFQRLMAMNPRQVNNLVNAPVNHFDNPVKGKRRKEERRPEEPIIENPLVDNQQPAFN